MATNTKRSVLLIVLAALLLALYLPARACCEMTTAPTPDPDPPVSSTRSLELFLPLVAGGALTGIEIVTPTPTNTATPTATSTPIPTVALRAIDSHIEVVEADFFDCTFGSFDTVLMNPPFAVQGNPLAYVDHIEHAWQFVAPGGVLVSVVPSGYKFRNDNKVARLRKLADTAAVKVVEEFGSDVAGMKTGVYMLVVGMRKAQ